MVALEAVLRQDLDILVFDGTADSVLSILGFWSALSTTCVPARTSTLDETLAKSMRR